MYEISAKCTPLFHGQTVGFMSDSAVFNSGTELVQDTTVQLHEM